MSVLVTGGAGYIGSHMCLALLEAGEDVVVLDDLSTGLRDLVPGEVRFLRGSVSDKALVRSILSDCRIRSVVHFAGSTVVPESVEQPLRYYSNNTAASLKLVEVCAESKVEEFIFSSTAAVYASNDLPRLSEEAPKDPVTPYGQSKLMTERILEDAGRAGLLRYVALRYFNVAGADEMGRSGQSTPNATHLVKRACQVALGRIPYLGIFGTDYPTPDGTGIRDYIHVSDLADAHLLALGHLRSGGASNVFNCGYGRGFSVREVISAVEEAVGRPVAVRELQRRAGDLPAVVADASKLKRQLRWEPRRDELCTIVRTALDWEMRLDRI